MFIAATNDHCVMIEVSAGIVKTKGKILAMKKGQSKHDYLSYKYEFPGGKVEIGEKPIEALKREFKEELKTDISNAKIEQLSDVVYDYPDFSVRIFPFVIEVENFIFEMTEHIDYQWVEMSSLMNIEWVEADKIIAERLVKNK